MSERSHESDDRTQRQPFPGASYLSALLIALALGSLVFTATSRQGPSGQATRLLAPTARPTQPPPTVYVAGEVRRPGVYTLPRGSRVKDAVDAAGGLTGRADPLAINLAERLHDQMKVVVPPRGALARPDPKASPSRATPSTPKVVDLNTGTQQELESLPGIGPSKARAIIEYRTQKGPFRTPADVQKVPGIGPKLWERIRPYVRV